MRKTKIKKLVKNLVLSSIVLLIFFIFFEIVLRLTWDIPGKGYPEGLHIPDDTKGYKYQPNFIGKFPERVYNDIEIKINSKGLRDYEHTYQNNSSKLQILGLGDSVTFGSGVEFEDSYLKQLENKFNKEGYDVEIIKAGINAYEFDQEYTYFFEEGYKYNPDIVMIGITLNDIIPVNITILKRGFNRKKTIKSIIAKRCLTCRFVYITLGNIYKNIKFQGIDYNQIYFEKVYKLWEGEPWEMYKSKLLKLKSYLDENEIELVLVIFPYTQQFENSLNFGRMPQEKLINLSKSNGIKVIDITPYLDVDNFKDYYLISDNVHLNSKGYGIVKEIIYSKLINENLVNKNIKK